MDRKIKFDAAEIGFCIAALTCTFVLILFAFACICDLIHYQDDEEDVIDEELGRTEAQVRKYIDGSLAEKHHDFHQQIYWQLYEDVTVFTSLNTIDVPSISQL